MSERVYVIAEAGSCHDGSLLKALRLVAEAAEAKADAVKFQYWSSAERMVTRRRAPTYRDIYARYAVPADWLPVLRAAAKSLGIDFICASYLPEDVDTVARVTDRLKVASFEAGDPEHLLAHKKWLNLGATLIVSLGLGHRAEPVLRTLGVPNDRVQFLHCVSAYPAPVPQLALLHVRHLGGFSDHSPSGGTVQVAMAVAAGARVIERHFRLNDTDHNNPDAGPHACYPSQLRDYVAAVRLAETIMGNPDQIAGAQPAEAEMQQYAVRSDA